ncbi:MAG: aminoglycoside phosphotransferase family protein [Lachnospiraceae bacterium]|nr:aminoglycoside phosphotransferase family protein [Lachnospiraceae bacterium]
MKSKTKYLAKEEEIKREFEKNGIKGIKDIEPLGDGEFNAAYKVSDGEKDYVLKIAPPADATVLNHEHDMMKAEVFWYEQMEKNTDIRIPKIYAVDLSGEIIKSGCFIMEMIYGDPLSKINVSEEENDRIRDKKIEMLTKIHSIKNDRFGYIQTKLYGDWHEALYNMASNLIADCKKLGYETPDGEKFLELIEKNKDVLKKAPCRMVNFDLWDSNVLYLGDSLCWIDPERSFWGDPIADFITLGKGQKTPLDEKKKEIEIYNRYATEPVSAGKEECIRYAAAVAFLALIEEVEKYVRYEPDEPNYIRNTVDARDMYDMAFSVME